MSNGDGNMPIASPVGQRDSPLSTSVIVLGAGDGSRFGAEDKLGALLGGRPIAHHVLDALRTFRWFRPLLVCRSGSSWSGAFRDEGFSIIFNDDAERGMLGSLRKGVAAAQNASRIMICLADMPLIGEEHVARLLAEAERNGDRIVATRADPYRGPPAIFPAGTLERLPAGGEGGARSLLVDALFVDCALARIFDVDTQRDLSVAEAGLDGKVRR